MLQIKELKIAIIGLGYVGLPLAVEFGKKVSVVDDRTILNDLFNTIKNALAENVVKYNKDPIYRDFRAGDVRHSWASITKIEKYLAYASQCKVTQGIKLAVQ